MSRKITCTRMTSHQKAMTFIELLIVVAVIGILTAIAYPSYQQHVLKSHRSTAMADMMKIQLELEQSKSATGSYNTSLVAAGTCSFCDTDTTRYQFRITTSASGLDVYKIIASPVQNSAQTNDSCGILTLNAGSVGTANTNNCW